jgi:hypothetical protein
MAYSCAHQRCGLFKNKRVWKQDCSLRIADHVLGHSTIIVQALVFCVLTETDISRVFTPMTRKALMLEEYGAHSLANLELRSGLGSYFHDSPHRLV